MAINRINTDSIPPSSLVPPEQGSQWTTREGGLPKVLGPLDLGLWRRTPGGIWAQPSYFSEAPAVPEEVLWIRHPTVGATPLKNLARFGEVPLNLTSEVDPMSHFFTLQTRAMKAAEDLRAIVSSLEAYTQGGDEGIKNTDWQDMLRSLAFLRQEINRYWMMWVRAYEKTWRLRSEEVSLSQLRSEGLVSEAYAAIRDGLPMPFVIKICLPFSKWNKLLGERAATQMKWDVLALCKGRFGAEPWRVNFMDSTGISVVFIRNEYRRGTIEDFGRNLSQYLEQYFKNLIFSEPGAAHDLRFVNGYVEVRNDRGDWLPLNAVINGDIFVGGARLRRVSLDYRQIKESVHAAEIMARARGEHVRQRVAQGEAVSCLDDRTPRGDLRLGIGYFPEGTIPTIDLLSWSVYNAVQQVAESIGLNRFLTLRSSHFLEAVGRARPLAALGRLVEEINGVSHMTHFNAEEVIRDILLAYDASHAQEITDPFTYFFTNAPHSVGDLLAAAIELMATEAGVARALHEVMSVGLTRDVMRRMRQIAGPRGALTRLGKIHRDLGVFKVGRRLQKGDESAISDLVEDCRECAEALCDFFTYDMLEAIEDSRFPGKIKSRAFPCMVRRLFKGKEIYYVVFDFDNLSNFLANPALAVRPGQRFDLSKYALENMIFETALGCGLLPRVDIIYSSPGGDEIEFAYVSGKVTPEAFLDVLRMRIRGRFGHIRSPASQKVWVPMATGWEVVEKWLLYEREGRPPIAIDLRDEARVQAYLARRTVDTERGFRGFQQIYGLRQGGILVEDLPMSSLTGARRSLNRVGVSATSERVTVHPGESARVFEQRLRGLRRDGLGLVETMKTRYGKDKTWDRSGALERSVLAEEEQEAAASLVGRERLPGTPNSLRSAGLGMRPGLIMPRFL